MSVSFVSPKYKRRRPSRTTPFSYAWPIFLQSIPSIPPKLGFRDAVPQALAVAVTDNAYISRGRIGHIITLNVRGCAAACSTVQRRKTCAVRRDLNIE